MSKRGLFDHQYYYGHDYSFGYSSAPKAKPITYASSTSQEISNSLNNALNHINHYPSIDLVELLESSFVKTYSKCMFCAGPTKIMLKDYNPHYASSAYNYSYEFNSCDKFISFECYQCNYYAFSNTSHVSIELGRVVIPHELSAVQLGIADGSLLSWLSNGDCFHIRNGKSTKLDIKLSNNKQKILDKLSILSYFK